MTEPSHAVFLSYASQDAEAAQKICEALRAAGIEVFLDQSGLRGGDVWIRRSGARSTTARSLFHYFREQASRHEGYFRLEWDLADQRTHMMARNRAFIVPVCLDATPGAGTDVPELLSSGAVDPIARGVATDAFVKQIAALIHGEATQAAAAGAAPARAETTPLRTHGRRTRWIGALSWPCSASPGVDGLRGDTRAQTPRPSHN